MDEKRVAIAGNNFALSAFSDSLELERPGGARADVHQRQIQQPQLRRDGGVHGRDGLQRHACHLEARGPHIGAGTTDIALCRDGSVVGYTMATVAGDEVTEAIMKAFLPGQEGGHHVGLHLAPGVVLQVVQGVIVQPVLGHGVAHQEHLPPGLAVPLEGLLGPD